MSGFKYKQHWSNPLNLFNHLPQSLELTGHSARKNKTAHCQFLVCGEILGLPVLKRRLISVGLGPMISLT
jgi:hypothetical protein